MSLPVLFWPPETESQYLQSSGGAVRLQLELWRSNLANTPLDDLTQYLSSAQLSMNLDQEIRLTGTFKIKSPGLDYLASDIDFLSLYVNLSYQDGRPTTRTQAGLYVIQGGAGLIVSETAREKTFKGEDPTVMLRDSYFSDTYIVTSGTVLSTAITTILTAAGITRYSIPVTTVTAPVDIVFARRSSRLEAVNALLKAYGCYNIYGNMGGYLTSMPVGRLDSREPIGTFTSSSIYSAIEEEEPTHEFYNSVLVIKDDPNQAPLSSYQVNLDPASPSSTVSKGFEKTRVESAPDLVTQTQVDAYAVALLSQARSYDQRIRLSVLPNALMDLHQTLDLSFGNYNGRWWIRTWDWTLPTGLITLGLNRVTNSDLGVIT